MKLVYVLPPVLAVLLGVQTLFGDGKAVGVLTEGDGAPRQFAQAIDQPNGKPNPASGKGAALSKASPWGVDPGAEPLPDGFADQANTDSQEIGEDDHEGALNPSGGGGSPPPIINAPPLMRPQLSASGALVSPPRVELIER